MNVERCENCGKPKTIEIFVGDRLETVPVSCDCEIDEMKQRLIMTDEENIKRALNKCFSYRSEHGTFEKSDSNNDAIETCKNYAKNFEEARKKGFGLLLYGAPDQGKTFAAECIADAIIKDGYRVRLETVNELVANNNPIMAKGSLIFESYWSNSLYVIDDLGSERGSEYVQSVLFGVIDRLYSSRKPIVITTNLTLEEMVKPAGIFEQRLYGRILERCLPVEFNTGRKRGNKENIEAMRKIIYNK